MFKKNFVPEVCCTRLLFLFLAPADGKPPLSSESSIDSLPLDRSISGGEFYDSALGNIPEDEELQDVPDVAKPTGEVHG